MASLKKIKVVLLASEWSSKHGGLSTFNRELAIQLANHPGVEVFFFLPKCDPAETEAAKENRITLVQAEPIIGVDELQWLCYPPKWLQIDFVIGHGVVLGCQAQIIRKNYGTCKWIQFVHTDPEELGMFKDNPGAVPKGEEKHQTEVKLCEMADFVVAVGPQLAEACRSYLRYCGKDKDVFELTPGIFSEFSNVVQSEIEGNIFRVLLFGRGDAEDFFLKGFDIAAKAVEKVNDVHLIFVGPMSKKQNEVAARLKECNLPAGRLRVRAYMEIRDDLKKLFSGVDLAIMPSRSEGFGLAALEALSAGLPILVSGNSGLGKALGEVKFGSSCVVPSEDAEKWAQEIGKVKAKQRGTRLEESKSLLKNYSEKYNWSVQTRDLIEKMMAINRKGIDFEGVVAYGVSDESDSDPSLATKSQMADGVERNESQVGKDKAIAIQGMLFNACDTRTFSGIDGAQLTPAIPVTQVSSTAKSEGSSFAAPAPAPAAAPAGSAPSVASGASAQAGQGRLQHDSIAGPRPMRYVNYLAYQGYSVEIIGGKHFKTPDGEFVELKSGTQYKIHVKNSHAYSCNLDVSIDGYDVGGWVVYGGEELTIERPAYEAKKFTFYRVNTAPKEAGIESGWDENGLVKCVFTPEAFLDIQVAISGSPHPLEVNIAPDATVGDLKRQVQGQLNAANDPHQLLVLNDTEVLLNSSRLSYLVKSPGNLRNLRLIDAELEITVELSSNEKFPVKIRPSEANVIDLMAVIEEKLGIPVKDQKVYHGKTRLSDAPQTGLPSKLICSLQPSVVVIVPEYITITVEDMESGEDCIVRVDKAKTLKDLVDEVSLCRNMSETEKAAVTFYFKGEGLCPSENDQSLSSLGFGSGSKIEIKRFVRSSEKGNDDDEKEARRSLLHFMEPQHPEEQLKRIEGHLKESQHYKKEAKGSILSRIWEKVSSPFAASRPPSRATQKLEVSGVSAPPRDPELDIIGARRARLKLKELPPCYSTGVSVPPEEDDEASMQVGGTGRESRLFAQGFDEVVNPGRVLPENDPTWKAGGTTLQGYSSQHFTTADPIKIDSSKKVELLLRLVAREDETDLVFPKEDFKPLSTLCPPAVPE